MDLSKSVDNVLKMAEKALARFRDDLYLSGQSIADTREELAQTRILLEEEKRRGMPEAEVVRLRLPTIDHQAALIALYAAEKVMRDVTEKHNQQLLLLQPVLDALFRIKVRKAPTIVDFVRAAQRAQQAGLFECDECYWLDVPERSAGSGAQSARPSGPPRFKALVQWRAKAMKIVLEYRDWYQNTAHFELACDVYQNALAAEAQASKAAGEGTLVRNAAMDAFGAEKARRIADLERRVAELEDLKSLLENNHAAIRRNMLKALGHFA